MTESAHFTDLPSSQPSTYEDLGGGLTTLNETGKLPRRRRSGAKQPLTGRAALGPARWREQVERNKSVLGTGKDVSATPEQLANNLEHLRQLKDMLAGTVTVQEVEPSASFEQTIESAAPPMPPSQERE